MKRVSITIICAIIVIGAIYTAIAITNNKKENNDVQEIAKEEMVEENIIDDCTNEYKEIEKEKDKNMIQANAEEEKVSPNCSFTKKTYYAKCGHTVNNYLELPKDIVNLTKEQVANKYQNFKIEEFNSNKIVLFKQVDDECGEHYIVKDNEGKVTVYKILEDGSERLFEETEIYTEYLTEADRDNMKQGIYVNGKQELNQLIEDFE